MRHGTDVAWHDGCRCEWCSKAHKSALWAAWYRKAKQRTPPTHGLAGYKTYGCRCEVCFTAGVDYRTARRAS